MTSVEPLAYYPSASIMLFNRSQVVKINFLCVFCYVILSKFYSILLCLFL